jgi:hypothetical protein
LKIAINAWFWDKPFVGSGQYLKYLVPALLEIDETLEIVLISPKPVPQEENQPQARLTFQQAPTPFPIRPLTWLKSGSSKLLSPGPVEG